MASISELRQEVAEVLNTAHIRAFDVLPERAAPPLVVIAPASPYLQKATQFGKHAVNARLDVMCVVKAGTNPKVSEELDALIEAVYVALDAAGFNMDEVTAPYVLSETPYLGATVRINSDIELGGSN